MEPLNIKHIRNLLTCYHKHIRSGYIIISDQWSACNNIVNLVSDDGISLQYQYHTVRQSFGFVNLARYWVHTHTIDRFWGDLRGAVNRRGFGKRIEQHF